MIQRTYEDVAAGPIEMDEAEKMEAEIHLD